MHYFLGMEVGHSADGIFLGKGKYAMDALKRFRMLDYKLIATPMESNLNLMSDASFDSIDSTMYRQIIGSLMNTIPNKFFVVNTLSQFLTDPRHVHLIAAKHILRYLKGTVVYLLKYEANQKISLEGYVD